MAIILPLRQGDKSPNLHLVRPIDLRCFRRIGSGFGRCFTPALLAFPAFTLLSPTLGEKGNGGEFRRAAGGCGCGSGRLEGVWGAACAEVGVSPRELRLKRELPP